MWDQRYAEPGFAYGTEPNDFLVQQAHRLAPESRVLCLAEGEGRNGAFLASLGHAVTAVDLSLVGLQKASQLAQSRGLSIETVHADLAAYTPEEGAWDAVVLIWAHLPPPVRALVHRRAAAALRPGGHVLLEAYTPEQIPLNTGGPRTADLLYTPDLLAQDFAGLHVEHLWAGEREVHEGRYHDGLSAVVQLVARR